MGKTYNNAINMQQGFKAIEPIPFDDRQYVTTLNDVLTLENLIPNLPIHIADINIWVEWNGQDKNDINNFVDRLASIKNSIANFEATYQGNSFVSEAEMTAYWDAQVTKPSDTKEFYRSDLGQLWKWNSSLSSKGEFSRPIVPLIEVIIEGAYVLKANGNNDFNNFEVNDKFRAWLGDRYVVGKIIATLTDTFANSVNDNTKIKLVIDNEI